MPAYEESPIGTQVSASKRCCTNGTFHPKTFSLYPLKSSQNVPAGSGNLQAWQPPC